MPGDLTIRGAQREVAEYLKAKGEKWTKLHNPYFRVAFLVEEIGELARGVINLESRIKEPRRRGLNRPHQDRIASVRDALGDILYHLLGHAVAYHIDLQTAFEYSMRNIKRRYPMTKQKIT